jgi:hypothetical protein
METWFREVFRGVIRLLRIKCVSPAEPHRQLIKMCVVDLIRVQHIGKWRRDFENRWTCKWTITPFVALCHNECECITSGGTVKFSVLHCRVDPLTSEWVCPLTEVTAFASRM